MSDTIKRFYGRTSSNNKRKSWLDKFRKCKLLKRKFFIQNNKVNIPEVVKDLRYYMEMELGVQRKMRWSFRE